jgi:hypothetical protein
MTTEFISTRPRLGLYCVWIATGNPRQPLACIWIDPQMRTYELEYVRPAPVTRGTQFGNEAETCRDRKARVPRQLGTSRDSD